MFVKDYMTRHPVLVDPGTSVVEAQSIMAQTKVRHLPVVEQGKRLVGLLTRERMRIPPTELTSLNVWEITRFLSNLKVRDVMVKQGDVVTTTMDTTLEDAALLMIKSRVGCLPVVDEGIVVGILTEVDMMAQLARLLGAHVPGVRITIRVPDRIGEFAKITGTVAALGGGIYASGGVPAPRRPGFWDCIIKVGAVPRDELVAALGRIDEQEIIDVREC